MLISFKVSNYKSLRDQQDLSMLPSRKGGGFDALPVAAIYGANASGKSNLIEALSFKDLPSGRWGEPLYRPFRLDRTSAEHATTYEIESELDGVRYEYRLSVSSEGVESEHLSAYPQNRKRILLDRTGEKITIGATMTNRAALQALSAETPLSAPALGMADTYKATEWQPFWKWLRIDLRLGGPIPQGYSTEELPEAVERHPVLVELAKVADLGITDMRVAESAVIMQAKALSPDPLDRAVRGSIEDLVAKFTGSDSVSLSPGIRKTHPNPDLISRFRRVEFYHQGHTHRFSEGDESRGTIAFLLYMARILDALRDGATLVIDEFDTSLHPRIIPRIIELFQDPRTNPKNAQLIFSTHDATLLGTSFGEPILNRDEIWFMEKQVDGASELYPLTSFKPRKEHNLERHYLGGSYGGVPDIHPESLVDIVAAANKTE